jgi:hypothetical protein
MRARTCWRIPGSGTKWAACQVLGKCVASCICHRECLPHPGELVIYPVQVCQGLSSATLCSRSGEKEQGMPGPNRLDFLSLRLNNRGSVNTEWQISQQQHQQRPKCSPFVGSQEQIGETITLPPGRRQLCLLPGIYNCSGCGFAFSSSARCFLQCLIGQSSGAS